MGVVEPIYCVSAPCAATATVHVAARVYMTYGYILNLYIHTYMNVCMYLPVEYIVHVPHVHVHIHMNNTYMSCVCMYVVCSTCTSMYIICAHT